MTLNRIGDRARRTALFAASLVFALAACGDTGEAGDEAGDVQVDPSAERANALDAVDLMEFASDPRQREGTDVRLADAPVDSRLGQTAFWLKLPNQGLYLVRGTAESTATAQAGQRVTVAGTVLPMTDSVVAAWMGDGSITADQEMEARYATSYLDAWYVSSTRAAGAAQER